MSLFLLTSAERKQVLQMQVPQVCRENQPIALRWGTGCHSRTPVIEFCLSKEQAVRKLDWTFLKCRIPLQVKYQSRYIPEKLVPTKLHKITLFIFMKKSIKYAMKKCLEIKQ